MKCISSIPTYQLCLVEGLYGVEIWMVSGEWGTMKAGMVLLLLLERPM